MYHGALVCGFVNISVYFNKFVNNLNHLIDFFLKKIKILLVIQSELELVSHFFTFTSIADAICHTLFYERRWFQKVRRKFILINSRLQIAHYSTVPNDKKTQHMIIFPYKQKLITCLATTVSCECNWIITPTSG